MKTENSTQALRLILITAVITALATLTLSLFGLLFLAYQDPSLLLNLANLRYCA
ncbi:MAG: hypothetical protein V4623_02005 [Pseudomonadota bacterium]